MGIKLKLSSVMQSKTYSIWVIFVWLAICLSASLTRADDPIVISRDTAAQAWRIFAESYKRYLNEPSSENAQAVIEKIPDSSDFNTIAATDGADFADLLNNQGGVLYRQILARDRQAVRLAFQLRKLAHGAGTLAESLDITLGQLIRIDPQLFLSELNRLPLIEINGLLLNLGAEYVDRSEASCYEMQMRIKSIQSVRDAGLTAIKKRATDRIIDAYNMECKKSPS